MRARHCAAWLWQRLASRPRDLSRTTSHADVALRASFPGRMFASTATVLWILCDESHGRDFFVPRGIMSSLPRHCLVFWSSPLIPRWKDPRTGNRVWTGDSTLKCLPAPQHSLLRAKRTSLNPTGIPSIEFTCLKTIVLSDQIRTRMLVSLLHVVLCHKTAPGGSRWPASEFNRRRCPT